MNQTESASAQRQEKYRLLKYLRFKQAVMVLILIVGLVWLFGWINKSLNEPVIYSAVLIGLVSQAAAVAVYGLVLNKTNLAGFGLAELVIWWLMWPLRQSSEALFLWLVILFTGLGVLLIGLSQPNPRARPGMFGKTALTFVSSLVIWLAGWLGLSVMSSTLYPLNLKVAEQATRSVINEQLPSTTDSVEVRSIVNPAGRLYLVRINQSFCVFRRNGHAIRSDGKSGQCRLPINWSEATGHEAPRWCAYLWSSPLYHRDYQTIPNGA